MSLPKLPVVMLLTAGIIFFILLRRKILNGRFTLRQQISFWALTCGVLLMYFPYLTDYIILGEETALHLSRIASLADSPYAILSLPALLYHFGFSLMTAYKLFVLLAVSMTAFLTHLAFRCLAIDDDIALAGNLLYLINPYYLHCLYVSGDVEHFTVYPLIPLLICLLLRIPLMRKMFLQPRRILRHISPVHQKMTLFFFTVFSIVVTIYQSNLLSYESYPYYIYSAQDIGSYAILAALK